MESRINETELSLLAHLHEEAAGCGPEFAGESAPMAQEIGVDMPTFVKARSYLAGWGLVGVSDDATYGGEASTYLTSLGEAYMREVEARAMDQQLVGAYRAGETAAEVRALNRRRDYKRTERVVTRGRIGGRLVCNLSCWKGGAR